MKTKGMDPRASDNTAAGRLVIVGLGPGGFDLLTVGALRELVEAPRLFIRTARHPVVDELSRMGLDFETFDAVYDSAASFDEVYRTIALRLLTEAEDLTKEPSPATASSRETGEYAAQAAPYVVYAVPGHPTVAEASVSQVLRLAKARGVQTRLVAGLSWMDSAYALLGLDPAAKAGLTLVDALERGFPIRADQGYLITQVYDRLVAGELKLRLAEVFGDTHRIRVVHHAGLPDERTETIALFRLDRLKWIDHLTSVYVPALRGKRRELDKPAEFPLDPLVEIMTRLRGENGCPWDREQTYISLKPYLIEEGYEVWEAIDEGNLDKLCDELGDVLLQVVFHSQLATEEGAFDVNDVIRAICEKMIRRHPHVFGDVQVKGSDEVLVNWEQIKKGEKGGEKRRSLLDGVPRHLPGLLTAQKIQGKAAKVGFEWETLPDAVKKVWEEARELQRAYEHVNKSDAGTEECQTAQDELEEEMGDLLFAVANVARYLKVNAEVALRRTVGKFYRRFGYIEEIATRQGKKLTDMTLDEMDLLWQASKADE